MSSRDEIVAIGLLTRENVDMLGTSLRRVFFIDQGPAFTDLIEALDEAERSQVICSPRRPDA